MKFGYWKVLASNLDSVLAEMQLMNIQAATMPYGTKTSGLQIIGALEAARDSRKRFLDNKVANKSIHKARLAAAGIAVEEVDARPS